MRLLYAIYTFKVIQSEFYFIRADQVMQFCEERLQEPYSHAMSETDHVDSFNHIGYIRCIGRSILDTHGVGEQLLNITEDLILPQEYGITNAEYRDLVDVRQVIDQHFEIFLNIGHDCVWTAHFAHTEEEKLFQDLNFHIQTIKKYKISPDFVKLVEGRVKTMKEVSDYASNIMYDLVKEIKAFCARIKARKPIYEGERVKIFQKDWPKVLAQSLKEYRDRFNKLTIIQTEVTEKLHEIQRK